MLVAPHYLFFNKPHVLNEPHVFLYILTRQVFFIMSDHRTIYTYTPFQKVGVCLFLLKGINIYIQ